MIGDGGTKKKATGHMQQTVGKLNKKMKVQNVIDGETYFLAKVGSQPRNIVFLRKNVWGKRLLLPHHHGRDHAKSHYWDMSISLQGRDNAFNMENG